jgi:NAD+ synthase (glutamine-hydrolysing)
MKQDGAMRIALAQLDLTIGAFDDSAARIAEAVRVARSRGADLLVLPELATVGYPPGDLVERRDFVESNLRQVERLAALTDDEFGILTGFVEPNEGDGKAVFNAAGLLWRGTLKGTVRKCLLPTYDVFDEARYFEPGERGGTLEFKGVPVGVTICEDAWSDPALWDRNLYSRDPVRDGAEKGARLLVNLSASPFILGKAERRRDMVRKHAASTGRWFVYVNQVGGNDELVFDGHSMVVDGQGQVVVRAHDFAEDLVIAEVPDAALGADGGVAGRPQVLRVVAERPEEEMRRALVVGLRDYVRKSGFSRVVLGLSGGIDSALTASLAVDALGADKVLGVTMPTRYSSEGSVTDAEALAENLGIEFRVIPVDDAYQTFLDTLAPMFQGLEPDVAEENIQARCRGVVLMALSNKFGSLVLATGNKSELAVGYCTLYGDMCGALAVISDVPKTWVYRLARWMNREREVIPESTLTKAPSAELAPGQTDQDSLPPYEVLDRILVGWVERNRSFAELVAEGLDPADVARVVGLIDRSEYKRRQAAPGIKISVKAFGVGRRVPVAVDTSALHRS